ncbi:hypothetical protein CCR83_03750 [Rhodobacter veldkampii DSM 11550]|uniref:Uncharacterized protein n=1 Tax=Phaeovulum veldkampii DSM 11550 TaxID=1185920 RepID=A0A2T4JIB4_9RHOB|nr:hypothetical protein [Phaeovulum veldkampii]MBK5945586.1 hypothetical protein [Phaeovulum veldkampii DSM 11550]NCU19497.1 hypothetical protein [Candidatus Falkowbacteria bacterium]PTE17527.1 hypothetical protein C5F46_09120 [Phaeovulum veldkampii DSM 11550]TDQ60197.1 hypothetical protein EV658_106150 [Phaeovulum veldkampii DSM 11550]
MTNRNMKNFEDRLKRIDQIHSAGGAFEASGALGRAYFETVSAKPRRRQWMRPLALILGGFVLFKGGLLAHLGFETYVGRLAHLQQGSVLERAGAWAMAPDGVTLWLAELFRPLIG